ncbi:MAG: adenylate kinase [bacterium]|nr:adenylate kinase [bacterium]MYD04691.1 adenylate kinase [Acidimicrobiia bacterium]
MKILFLGPPGVGKGTQAVRVAEALEIPHISTGEMFREHMDSATGLGKQISRIVARGDLVPDSLTVAMLLERLGHSDTANGYILDGFPRNLPQAHALDEAIGEAALDAVVVLQAEFDMLKERLLNRGRADDTEESVSNRLVVYERETAPLVRFYEDRGVTAGVNGVGSVEEITANILAALARFRP